MDGRIYQTDAKISEHPSYEEHLSKADEFELPIEMWTYLFGYLSQDEVDDLADKGVFRKGNLKKINSLWKYLYIEAFGKITSRSKLSVQLKQIDNKGTVKGFLHDMSKVSPEVQRIYEKHPFDKMNNDNTDTSLWYDLFQHDWMRMLHIYTCKETGKVIRYDYPRGKGRPLFDIWIDFNYNADISEEKQWVDFGLRMHRKEEMNMSEYSAFNNIFENTGVVVTFQYRPEKNEIGENFSAKRIITRFMIDSKGNQVNVDDIDKLLQCKNVHKRPVVLDIDLVASPIILSMKNIEILNKTPIRGNFKIGVFVTKQGIPYNERTIGFKTNTDNQEEILLGNPADGVLHEIENSTSLDAQENSPTAKAVRGLLLANKSKLQSV